MTIPSPRTFLNPQNLSTETVVSRLKALDSAVFLSAFQQSGGGFINYVLVWSGTLTDQQIVNSLSSVQTPTETTALTTKQNSSASKSSALVASGLLGTNISAANSNAARDALIKALCMSLSICDENGVIINI